MATGIPGRPGKLAPDGRCNTLPGPETPGARGFLPATSVSLPHADYSDTFHSEGDAFHSAEAWARAAFEQGSRRDVDAKQLVWRRLLQLRLGSFEATDRVAGWEIVENTDRRLVLAAESWHLTARLVSSRMSRAPRSPPG